ncbi:hypothetical protein GUJ93_ZPchr0001g30593 [Zizania palustris]|uniref:Uncharacterized protein n=1 Tax=Zizania palustris TaxID=103762 RepID=A0A8J5VTR1_ZIZPA|nr:hypothetical protein GUJ93_ZPchr0001g30593 [Zizania palustris]
MLIKQDDGKTNHKVSNVKIVDLGSDFETDGVLGCELNVLTCVPTMQVQQDDVNPTVANLGMGVSDGRGGGEIDDQNRIISENVVEVGATNIEEVDEGGSDSLERGSQRYCRIAPCSNAYSSTGCGWEKCSKLKL